MNNFKQFILSEACSKHRKMLIDYFTNNLYPKDEKIHELADKLKMEPDDLESEIYSMLTDFFGKGLYNKAEKKANIDSKQLKMGIKVELEHTSCPLIAERIAKDHLQEIPDYYTRLDEMEKEAKKGEKED